MMTMTGIIIITTTTITIMMLSSLSVNPQSNLFKEEGVERGLEEEEE
jgi:hypothetical protein